MKRIFCLLMAMALCFAGFAGFAEVEIQPAAIETPAAESADAAENTPEASQEPVTETIALAFEDGFVLDLPADWKYYPLNAEMAAMGVIYCLSDAAGERWMYIQKWNTDCADMDQLLEVVSAASDPGNSGIREFNGTEFIIYNIAAENVSCCAAMVGGKVLNFVFTPQTDMDFMAQAVQIIGTFREV